MSRLIFLVAIIAIIYWLLRTATKPRPSAPSSNAAEEMVRCAHCGVHLPKSESILANGNYYCSAAHHHEHTQRSE